jgi:cyclopropane-fatty-acyl-phospholipid synthase
MNIDKVFYQNFTKDLSVYPYEIKYWDGEVINYGVGEAQFRIVFNEPLSKSMIIKDPCLAFGEGYMQKKIDIEGSIQTVIESLYNRQDSFLRQNNAHIKLVNILSNTKRKRKENIQFHYDLGNDFYRLWLDETLMYSCAYFKSPEDSLAQAQRNKVDHILKKLNLHPGQTLLDIGCGWGELILTAAKKYQVKALGITLSSEQFSLVVERIQNEGLHDLVEVQLMDYQEIKNRTFDRVVSVGMIEHVGKEHLEKYFSTVKSLLNEGGVSLLHCITGYEEKGRIAGLISIFFRVAIYPQCKSWFLL